MTRKLFLAACLITATFSMGAQEGILSVRNENLSGKDLTMEDVILNREIYPVKRYYSWDNDGVYRYWDKEWKAEGVDGSPASPLPRPAPEAFSRDGSLFLSRGGDTLAIAVASGALRFGESVSRNEFGINGGIFPSPGGSRIAFYRKDESRVSKFPLLDITTRTGSLKEIRYPMNGMDSERISLGIYDKSSGKTVYVKVSDFTPERYLTNVSWSPDDRYVFIQVVDRSQHHCRLNQYSASNGSFVRTLLTEEDPAWTEPLDPVRFLKGRTDLFIYRTDNRDGYRNLYLADTLGNIRRLTGVDADVSYIADDGRSVWYTSAEVSPVENHLFRIDLRIPSRKPSGKTLLQAVRFGNPSRLTFTEGWHEISMNPSCTWFLDTWSSVCDPGGTDLSSSDGKIRKPLYRAGDPLEGYRSCEMDFGTVQSADGEFRNYYRLFKPLGFDPSKKYPVIVYVYGGPHSQMVRNSWLGGVRMWEMYMAQKGYLVYVQDNRGTENRGERFEKAINRRCGAVETEDQMEGIAMLKKFPFVDGERIGVHGWSYGGFMTITMMTSHPDVFKVGVAGGPVIDWKWYEIMYGERYMDTMETNPEGFAQTSLIGKAGQLEGKLLICQGAIDNTVVWEHSLSFVSECIGKNIQLDYFPYPCAEHNVRGKDRVHLMDKVTMYFDDYL
ncbi:MAG: DPP IV N-terminal domain-containing protein [Bacteroidales bacterium]|nr:DPP IV N-terminal domain-containing protein [Bacteroidales bacterium]